MHKVSKTYILNINEFMENFLDIKYEGKNKLTHKEMLIYLWEKKAVLPERISFKKINKEKILKGYCLMVKDESNKVMPYVNPKRLDNLMQELLIEQQKYDFSERRKKILAKKQTKADFIATNSSK